MAPGIIAINLMFRFEVARIGCRPVTFESSTISRLVIKITWIACAAVRRVCSLGPYS
jgi:hypothetical protein